ncbi:MAG: phospholipid scramblase-related protein, partial [Actinomycetota bacterium]|nr:phospholipid scramblase-related protein [Actinomycetota bacterium]
NNEYKISDTDGQQVGAVRQIGQSKAKKVLRFVSSFDQFMTHQLEVVDAAGAVVLSLTRPAKLLKSKVEVSDGTGAAIGRIVQLNAIGKIRFGLEGPAGEQVGTLNGENWRAWNFNIQDAGGNEVARITKKWEGFAKTLFTTADNYVVQVNDGLGQPLKSLCYAAALAVDTALKQDARGLG